MPRAQGDRVARRDGGGLGRAGTGLDRVLDRDERDRRDRLHAVRLSAGTRLRVPERVEGRPRRVAEDDRAGGILRRRWRAERSVVDRRNPQDRAGARGRRHLRGGGPGDRSGGVRGIQHRSQGRPARSTVRDRDQRRSLSYRLADLRPHGQAQHDGDLRAAGARPARADRRALRCNRELLHDPRPRHAAGDPPRGRAERRNRGRTGLGAGFQHSQLTAKRRNDMGDPTDPGEDQETTIIIEGPPEDADAQTIARFNATFESFKSDMSSVLKKYHTTLKSRLRKIEYIKKKKDD